jgi:hypothetical protein
MVRFLATVVLAGLSWGIVGTTPSARAHATYNLSGYGAGVGGSTNGADGDPATPEASWTSGPTEYTGKLPVNWYCGLHNPTQVRTIQTGAGPEPPSGSLLAQVNSHNAQSDPDLPADRVLAVGAVSWSNPDWFDQGWGHGLDYGLIHVSPVESIVADGTVKLTITLADDPTDAVAVRLAYALYAGWDTSTTASRHQTFVTNPSPVDDPLGSSGLTLVDFAVATAPGQTISRSYDVVTTHEGEYTLLIGSLGDTSGQYQVTAGLFPSGQPTDEELAQCTTSLAQATTDLTQAMTDLTDAQTALAVTTSDVDGDGVPDVRDGCAATAAGAAVDDAGCSQGQFCGALPAGTKAERRACKKADWKNDEPLMATRQADCTYVKASRTCGPTP